jgi:hypothetical protein
MDNIDLPTMGGLTGLLTFVIGAVVRAYIKDRREAKERAEQIFMTCVRSAYNAVVNRVKKGETIDNKSDAGLEELDKFMRIRLRRVATQEERERAMLEFDAIHGEQCPGGTPNTP